jgi:hypothetical protein
MTLYIGNKPIGLIKIIKKDTTGVWQPNPNWWNIKKILNEDTRDYKGKVGVVLYNFNDVSDFILSSSAMNAVATSDGAFYSYANNGAQVSHKWDTSKDKDDGRGFKTRWVIYYYKTDSTSDTFQQSALKFGWAYNYIAYLVLRINCTSGSSFCGTQRLLEAIDNVGYRVSGTSFASFCSNCNSLQKLPDGLDTSKGTNFSYFCSNCSSLQKLNDVLDTSKGTVFNNFCHYCYNLKKLPDGLDTSKGTNFNYFCSYCYNLEKLPDGLDTSSGTNFSSFCSNCYGLQKLSDALDTSKGTNFSYFCSSCSSLQHTPEITMVSNTTSITSKSNGAFPTATWLETVLLTLPSNTNVWLDMSTRISIESFRYIADHAPDVTATPRTLTVGSTNISRINAEDPTIITDLQAKGWTVK